MSILALIVGCSVFSACLYYTPIWIEETQVNAMELAEVSSVVACITTATILLGYTWQSKGASSTIPESSDSRQTQLDGASGDLQAQLVQRLESMNYGPLISDVKFKKRDDVMTYLAVGEKYRTLLFAAVLFMVVGLIMLMFCFQLASQGLTVLAVCTVTPIIASMAYNQPLLGDWQTRQDVSKEGMDWILEIITLTMAITTLILLDDWTVESTRTTEQLSVLVPIASAFCIGNSLGLYRKIALADERLSPRVPTVFIFYVTLAMIFLTPLLKYPLLSNQINTIAQQSGDPFAREMESDYYKGRGWTIALFFMLGLLATFAAFAICNALQHPQISLGNVNLLMTLKPVILCMILDFDKFFLTLSGPGLALFCTTLCLIVLVNVLKLTGNAPLFCKSEKEEGDYKSV